MKRSSKGGFRAAFSLSEVSKFIGSARSIVVLVSPLVMI